jgi:hypothetical protein
MSLAEPIADRREIIYWEVPQSTERAIAQSQARRGVPDYMQIRPITG